MLINAITVEAHTGLWSYIFSFVKALLHRSVYFYVQR